MADQNITNTDDGKFKVKYEADNGKSQTAHFDSYAEAQRFLTEREAQHNDTPERAASEMTPEDAEEINSNVIQAPTHGEPLNTENNDPGTGNRTAPHETKTTANDDNGKTD